MHVFMVRAIIIVTLRGILMSSSRSPCLPFLLQLSWRSLFVSCGTWWVAIIISIGMILIRSLIVAVIIIDVITRVITITLAISHIRLRLRFRMRII